MTNPLEPNDLSHLSDEEFVALCPQGFHGIGDFEPDFRALCGELARLARQDHYTCEDRWYSCPKSLDGCANDSVGDECTCGANSHNDKIDELLARAALATPPPEPPSPKPSIDDILSLAHDHFTFRGNSHGGQFFATSIKAKTNPAQALLSFARAVLERWGQ